MIGYAYRKCEYCGEEYIIRHKCDKIRAVSSGSAEAIPNPTRWTSGNTGLLHNLGQIRTHK